MPVLFPLESLFRKCNKYHDGEYFEPGVFLPDIDDFVSQKTARDRLAGVEQDSPRPPPQKLEPEELDALQKIYNKYKDADGLRGESGTRAAHEAGASPSVEEQTEFETRFQKQKATFEEFKEYVDRSRHPEDTLEELCYVFEYWDPKKTGNCRQEYFSLALNRFYGADKLSEDETTWITDNFTTADSRGFIDYRDAVRRLMEDPEETSGGPEASRPRPDQEEVPGEPEAAPPPPPSDPITLIYEGNTEQSPSGRRRRTSKFISQLHFANVAATRNDLPEDKEYLTKEELAEVVHAIGIKYLQEEEELIRYFEFYDTTNSGTVKRSVVVWQVQALADTLTSDEAAQIVDWAAPPGTVDYREFVKKILSRPENATIVLTDEVDPTPSHQMLSAQVHNAELPSSIARSGSIVESMAGEAELQELGASAAISMVLSRSETTIRM